VALLAYSQTLTMLPISLFGMSVAAAELPEMSSSIGAVEETHSHIRGRLAAGLRQIAFFVVPSAVAFLVLGDVIAAALYQHGRFTERDTLFTWGVLAGASIGLLASALGRLYSSGFYALHDTRTPLRIALVRVVLATVLGYVFALHLPRALDIAPQWGAAALTLSSSLVAWVEYLLLRGTLNDRIGVSGVPTRFVLTLLGIALASAAAAFGVKLATLGLHRILTAVLVLGTFGLLYLGLTRAVQVPESVSLIDRVRRRLR
jgi:putative peptidoglycan lipid II flippase